LLLTLAAGLRPSPLTSLLLQEVGVVAPVSAAVAVQGVIENFPHNHLMLGLPTQSRSVLVVMVAFIRHLLVQTEAIVCFPPLHLLAEVEAAV
jgi:hypothetical protein